MWRKVPDFRAEKKGIESCHVSGCHGFSDPDVESLVRDFEFLWVLVGVLPD